MNNLFCGALVAPAAYWRDFVPAPKPPANYTKQETIDAWVEKRWLELPNEVSVMPFLGRVVDFAAVDDAGEVIISAAGCEAYAALSKLVSPLCAAANCGEIRLWGVHMRSRVHQLAVNALAEGFAGPTWGLHAASHTSRPAELSHVRMFDPVKLLLGGNNDEHVASTRKLVNNDGAWTSAAQMAQFVRDLVYKFNMHKALF